MKKIVRDKYVYYLFSAKQRDEKRKVMREMGRDYIPDKVKTNSGYVEYTEVSSSPTNPLYTDSTVVAKGYLSKMNTKRG